MATTAPPEPAHYHIGAYHAPTPLTLKGATVVSTAAARKLWLAHAAFVDVWPQPPKPVGLPKGTLWIQKPRLDIPGSIWLPDTGYGQISGRMEFYFEDGLATASHHDRSTKLVIYCLKDCWMSWNAARRAITLGYKQVYWYPGGSDSWQRAGFPLTRATEAPGR